MNCVSKNNLQARQKDTQELGYEKAKQIGLVLGLVEEAHKSKDWILHQIKKHGLNLPTTPNMNIYEILALCNLDFINLLLDSLKGNDIVPPTGVKMKVYHWFFSDIVAGSNPSIPTNAQVTKIIVLNELISKISVFKNRDPKSTVILPTGDGMAIGFSDSPENPFLLSIELYKELGKYNQSKKGKEKLLLRVGLESGPVFFIKDLNGKDNVWGPGIILTRRVMDLCGDTQIYAAGRIAEELVRISPEYQKILHFVENYETKYGEKIPLFNVYGEGFGSKTAPLKPKKSSHGGGKVTASNFTFSSIDVLLDVLDAKSMQTRHTWIWDMVNISKEPKSKISYFIDGQTAKDFEEIHVKVTDSDGKKLKIGDISVNKPYRKEFSVILDKPVLPKQRIVLKLQYDWEETDRSFMYKFPSGAKKFSYTCTLAKEINLKSRVLKTDLGTGQSIHATPPATIKRSDDGTVISWAKSGIIPSDAYIFQW